MSRSSSRYLTPRQVARALRTIDRKTFKPGVVRLVKAWKRANRGHLRTRPAIEALYQNLGEAYEKPVRVAFPAIASAFGGGAYEPSTQTIYLDPNKISIVTALHEFAHHLHGSSELAAFRWSVGLFARTFRRTFERAEFDGHMMRIRRRPRPTPPTPDFGPTDDRPCSECDAVHPEPHGDGCPNAPENSDSRCCSHSHCTTYTTHPSGLCGGHRSVQAMRVEVARRLSEMGVREVRWVNPRTNEVEHEMNCAEVLAEEPPCAHFADRRRDEDARRDEAEVREVEGSHD